MRGKERDALPHVVVYVEYVVYVGHPYVELQLRAREGTLPVHIAVETATMARRHTKTGPNTESTVKIGTRTSHRLRLVTATVTPGLIGDTDAKVEIRGAGAGIDGAHGDAEAQSVGAGDVAAAPRLGQQDARLRVDQHGVGAGDGLGADVVGLVLRNTTPGAKYRPKIVTLLALWFLGTLDEAKCVACTAVARG